MSAIGPSSSLEPRRKRAHLSCSFFFFSHTSTLSKKLTLFPPSFLAKVLNVDDSSSNVQELYRVNLASNGNALGCVRKE